MPSGPLIVTPRTAPPPLVVLRPMAAGLGALVLTGLWLAVFGMPQGQRLLGLIHLALVAGLLTLATAASVQLGAATTGRSHPQPGRLGLLLLLLPAGGTLLSIGFLSSWLPLVAVGGTLACVGLISIFSQLLVRVAHGRSFGPLHLGLLLGLLGFVGAALGGLLMATGLVFDQPQLLAVLPWHLALAFGLGFGVLLTGVSWQLLPMFSRVRQVSGPAAFLPPALFAVTALLAALLWGRVGIVAAWPLVAAALCHATLTAWALARGSRGKLPPFTGLAHLAAALSLLFAAFALSQGLAGQALLAAFGGYAIAVLGYLERILPFIVFEAHLARRDPQRGVPKLKEILPPGGRGPLLLMYLAALGLALTGWPPGLRIFGIALAALAVRLLLALGRLPTPSALARE